LNCLNVFKKSSFFFWPVKQRTPASSEITPQRLASSISTGAEVVLNDGLKDFSQTEQKRGYRSEKVGCFLQKMNAAGTI